MCGILGIFKQQAQHKEQAQAFSTEQIIKAYEAQGHRGRDGYGFCTEKASCLTKDYDKFKKAIQEISAANTTKTILLHNLHAVVNQVVQPIQHNNKDNKKEMLAFKGEIYNWKELKQEHQLKGENDTEILSLQLVFLFKFLPIIDLSIKRKHLLFIVLVVVLNGLHHLIHHSMKIVEKDGFGCVGCRNFLNCFLKFVIVFGQTARFLCAESISVSPAMALCFICLDDLLCRKGLRLLFVLRLLFENAEDAAHKGVGKKESLKTFGWKRFYSCNNSLSSFPIVWEKGDVRSEEHTSELQSQFHL